MGAVQSLKLDELEGKQDVPNWTFTPLPPSWQGTPGKMVKMFNALPPKPNLRKIRSDARDEAIWWPDCQFVPYKDNRLVTSLTGFLPRPGRTPMLVSNHIEGLIAHWELNERIKVEIFKNSRSRSIPRVVPSPNGKGVLFLGAGNISFMDLETLHIWTKAKTGMVSSFHCCALSPNGVLIATIARTSTMFELSVNFLGSRELLSPLDSAMCHYICKGFVGTRTYTEEVECKWSPDSSCIAVGSSFGLLFVVKRKALKPKFCLHEDLELPVCTLSNARCFDFDPRYRHSHIAIATTDNFLYTINIDDKSVMTEVAIATQDLITTIDCVSYNKDGTLLAVATSEATVYMYNCDNATLSYKLELDENSGGQSMRAVTGQYPTIVRMSFGHAGSTMATSSTDGMIRIWQLPNILNLQHLCKMTILQNVPISRAVELPLPNQLIQYLLNCPAVQ